MGKVDKVYHRMGKVKLAILGFLASAEGEDPEEIAKRAFQIARAVGTPRPNVLRSLKSLEKEGLVAKVFNIEWRITMEGRDALEEALDERRKRAQASIRRGKKLQEQLDKLDTT